MTYVKYSFLIKLLILLSFIIIKSKPRKQLEMGGSTIWPVPRAIDAEAHYYPRMWKRNLFFFGGALFLIGLQFNRYANMVRVSHCLYNKT